MSLLKRWRASEKNLVGPDVGRAPFLEIELSGSKIKFRNPPLTVTMPCDPPVSAIDIYDESGLSKPVHDFERASGRVIYVNGWSFFSGVFSDSAVGGLLLDMIIFRLLPDIRTQYSLLSEISLINYTLQGEEASNEWTNKKLLARAEPGNLRTVEQTLHRYPKSVEDVSRLHFNGFDWLKYSISQPGKIGTIKYRAAITNEHYIDAVFRPSSYHKDYYSPAHNLQEVVPRTIEEFMQNMHVQLSPEAQKQKLAATPARLSSPSAQDR